MGGCASKIAPVVAGAVAPITTLDDAHGDGSVSAKSPELALFASGARHFAARRFEEALIDFKLCDRAFSSRSGVPREPKLAHLPAYIEVCELQLERTRQRRTLQGGGAEGGPGPPGLQRQPSDKPSIVTLSSVGLEGDVSAHTPEDALYESGKRLFVSKRFDEALLDFGLCKALLLERQAAEPESDAVELASADDAPPAPKAFERRRSSITALSAVARELASVPSVL